VPLRGRLCCFVVHAYSSLMSAIICFWFSQQSGHLPNGSPGGWWVPLHVAQERASRRSATRALNSVGSNLRRVTALCLASSSTSLLGVCPAIMSIIFSKRATLVMLPLRVPISRQYESGFSFHWYGHPQLRV
jgi:hypothetical protein